ncbi:hypothetical protein [Streptomyces thermovulgaris]|uniref:hypothetical protein n=1 Tax=Streptomyces thermovulgaris TaxID=1934 RepID=UPI001FE4143E|nr:hypothetical protein [Streptomyces thermovulgaris]
MAQNTTANPRDRGKRSGGTADLNTEQTDMRTLLTLLLSWLLPARGRRRAIPPERASVAATADAEQKSPVRRLIIAPSPPVPRPEDAEDFAVIVADGLPLVRPYLLAHEACEREQERLRQWGRRHAAALAVPLGQGHPAGVTA